MNVDELKKSLANAREQKLKWAHIEHQIMVWLWMRQSEDQAQPEAQEGGAQ